MDSCAKSCCCQAGGTSPSYGVSRTVSSIGLGCWGADPGAPQALSSHALSVSLDAVIALRMAGGVVLGFGAPAPNGGIKFTNAPKPPELRGVFTG